MMSALSGEGLPYKYRDRGSWEDARLSVMGLKSHRFEEVI